MKVEQGELAITLPQNPEETATATIYFSVDDYGDIAITTTGEENYTQFDFNFTEEQWAVIVDTISVQLRAQKLSS
ncbi:hypothetical protein [Enterococcus phage EFLK1]|uniref:Uncharacterized protein n=3 Tax=Kochikohdavirus TaxID=2560160 RepID=A0A0E3TA39_9CAUD|nr:hypothetical protein AVT53_gp169 [Enterococcus phage EFLK1]AKC05010.1 hypothetical protein [Enterococcus phage EFLK1]AZU99851.1 hypothetical protein vBEfaHEF1TV_7 [Enterococcus phage vB_EfaH_EF1TV]UYB00721.1 hypothetical protein GMNKNHGO_00094 [Enterococcus phage vB_Efa29212_3e]